MNLLRRNFGWTVAAALLISSSLVSAQDPKFTASTLSQVDRDYWFQGEFVGCIKLGITAQLQFGMQLVALGDGQFEGQLLMGGLPNEGWNGFARIPLHGKRTEGILSVSGGAYKVEVRGTGKAYVRYADGQLILGELQRVERTSPTLGAPVPCGGKILFNGDRTCCWKNGKLTPEGDLAGGTETIGRWRDYTLHVEFRTPYMPGAKGQGRGNSGVYLNGRYEVQILDSFGLSGADNEAGGLYRYKRPDVNMAFPPLQWQTYDIEFRSARFDENGVRTEPARVTVRHNGVLIHDDVELDGPTGGGAPETEELLPIKLQDHGNPVQFRNIWMVHHCDPLLDDCCSPCSICCCKKKCYVCCPPVSPTPCANCDGSCQ